MSHRTVTLSDFDQLPIIEYNITSNELVNVHRYLQAMQGHLTQGTWAEISSGGYYGTSALLHEIVELRILLNRDPYLLTRSNQAIKNFARHPHNYDAHLRGLEAEYRYLQEIVFQEFGQSMNIGALAQANTQRLGEWDDLFETNLPFTEPSPEEISEAETVLKQLREWGRNKS